MAVTIRTGKRFSMDYIARDFLHSEWRSHLSYHVLKRHLKFSVDEVTFGAITSSITNFGGDEEVGNETGTPLTAAQPTTSAVIEGSALRHEDSYTSSSKNESRDALTSGGSVLEGNEEKTGTRPRGRKSKIPIRAIDKQRTPSVENVRLIAQSLERKNELEEERSALVTYTWEECETQEDLADRAEYLQLLRKDRLKALRKRILASEQRIPMSQTLPSLDATPTSNAPFGESAPYSVKGQDTGGAGDE